MGYYRGDPGFFSLLKSIGSSALSFVPGVGPIASKALSIIPTGARSLALRGGAQILKHPALSAAGGAAVVGLGAAAAGRAGVFGRAAGKHPSARHMRALAMGLRRAKPRMNVTNVHALRKALRRTYGFARLAMRVIHITHPKKKGRFGGYRKSHKKKM